MGITRFNAGDGYAHYVGRDGVSLEILPQARPIIHPFRITTKVISGVVYVNVRAGTVNNIVPTIDGTPLNEPNDGLALTNGALNYVYIKASKGASPVFFPDTVEIVTSTTSLSDTNDDGYILIGDVTIADNAVTGKNQYVYASQVVVRAKPGDATALWLWSSR